MANNYFNIAPVRLDMPRSKFPVKFNHKTSFNLGELVPVLCQEVLPGDTFSYDLKSLIRMTTLKAPIMDNLWIDAFAFFVPSRLLWSHQQEFCGENRANAGPQTTEYLIPSVYSHQLIASIGKNSLGNYLGLPLITKPTAPAVGYTDFSVLPARGYVTIWNEWFRDENLENPVIVSTGDTYLVATDGSYDYSSGLLKANKVHDYFTSLLPWPLKAAANVSIPLGTTAPLSTGGLYTLKNAAGNTGSLQFGSESGSYNAGTVHYLTSAAEANGVNTIKMNENGPAGDNYTVHRLNLYADLSKATAASINSLRYAFQVQKLLERDAVGGTRYWEMLHAHYGVTSPDASLQRPEYLGGRKFKVNVQQVVQTSADTATDPLGSTGALSVTGDSSNLFTKSFTEFGYLYILVVARQEHTYSQGIPAMFSRKRRFDFYYPEFANLGYQEVKKKEIYFSDVAATDENTFGYKEPWAEYRFLPARVSGMINPNASSSLNFWTLADELPSNVSLSGTFIQETPDNLDRVLTVASSTADQLMADFDVVGSMVRLLPVYSVPGLIDHH